jgi:hypothetical protein
MAATPPRGAVLVVRIWREPGVAGFRGRISYRVDATETAETEVVVHSADQLYAAVQEWLDAFVTAKPPTAQ